MRADRNKNIPRSGSVCLFLLAFLPVFNFFFNSQRKPGFRRFQLSLRHSRRKCSSISRLHANEQKANVTTISHMPTVCLVMHGCTQEQTLLALTPASRQHPQPQPPHHLHGSCA